MATATRTTNTFSDGVTTVGLTSLTSATAAFTSDDEGMFLYGTNIPFGAYIVTVNSSTQVFMSEDALATGTGLTFTMLAPLPLEIQGGKIPLNYEPTPAQYYVALASRLRGDISGEEVILGSSEADAPVYNAGPWITDKSWRYWDEATMKYIATVDVALGSSRQRVSASPTADRTQYLPNQSGMAALLTDIYVPRATTLLTPDSTIDIDFEESNTFLGRLDQDTTITFSGTNIGRKTVICLLNNGTAFTVTWPATVLWVGADPTQPVASAGQTVAGVYVIRSCPSVAPQELFGEYVGEYTISGEGSSVVSPGGPGAVPVDYGDPIGLGDGEENLP